MDHITIEPPVILDQLGAAYALRRFDWATFGPKHSDYTPDLVNDCIHNVRDGIWHAFLVKGGGDVLSLHYLHDRQSRQNSTWVGGFVPKEARGRDQLNLRKQLWTSAREHIEHDWGFTVIHAYVMATNRAGIRWAEEACELVRVGRLLHAVKEEGKLADIIVYTQYRRDIGACLDDTARLLIPPGQWDAATRELYDLQPAEEENTDMPRHDGDHATLPDLQSKR